MSGDKGEAATSGEELAMANHSVSAAGRCAALHDPQLADRRRSVARYGRSCGDASERSPTHRLSSACDRCPIVIGTYFSVERRHDAPR